MFSCGALNSKPELPGVGMYESGETGKKERKNSET